MQYFVYWLIAIIIAYAGYRFGLAVSAHKIWMRESEIMELRKLTAYWQKMFWREINNNTKMRNSVDETCRN